MICLQVLRDPYHLAKMEGANSNSMKSCGCSKSFCKTCIDPIYNGTKRICPGCNVPFTNIVQDGITRLRLMDPDKKVRCIQSDGKGNICKAWEGSLRDIDQQHLNPSIDNELEGCLYLLLNCDFCEKQFCRKSMVDHKRNCPKRPYSCDYCNKYSSDYTDVTTKHLQSCPSSPDVIVKCPFNYAGCSVSMPRKALDDHNREHMMHHMTLIAEHGEKRVAKGEKRIAKAEEEIFELKEEMSRLSNEHNNTVIELKKDIKSLTKNLVVKTASLNSVEQVVKTMNTTFPQEIESAKKEFGLSLEEKCSKAEFECKEKIEKVDKAIKEKVKRELSSVLREEKQERKQLSERVNMFSELTEKLTELPERVDRLANHVDRLLPIVDNNAIAASETPQRFKRIDEAIKEVYGRLERNGSAIETNGHKLQEMSNEINITVPSRCGALPVDIVMTDFSLWQMENREWCSPPFYIKGHKLCMTIYADGDPTKRSATPSSRGSLSLYVHILKGDQDDELNWPFRSTIIVKLLHPKLPMNHKVKEIPFNDSTPDLYANRVRDKSRTKGWGYADFIKHRPELEHYLRANRSRLHIRVMSA